MAQFQPIINFAVKDDVDGAILIAHRLMPLREVNNRKPAVRQTNIAVDTNAAVIRSAVPLCIIHAGKQLPINLHRRKIDYSSDPAHFTPQALSGT
jgi:hypothetical protein